jgi:nucleotide-binding universal stress UspA family protein
MPKIERILCPVDFSEFSAKAYDYACSLARHYEAKLLLAHVVSLVGATYPNAMLPDGAVASIYSNLTADAEKRLQEMAQERSSDGLKCEFVVQKGFVPGTILALAEEHSADLIVMGTHGRRGWDRLMIGSVTESVLRKARCPVLAVRKPAHDFIGSQDVHDDIHLRKVLFCTDFSDSSLVALEYALSLAEEYHAELTVLHVLEKFPGTQLQAKTEQVKHEILRPIPPDALDACTLKASVRVGKPYQEIIQVAVQDQTDLVVLGVRGRNIVDLAVFGSTTYRVIQLGPCPVLAVHVETGTGEKFLDN